jgi:hypothetical protein
MSEENRPHPLNVEGPFYVLDGCCTACGVPESVAPEHFAWDGENQCFVRRQPRTEMEVGRVLGAMRAAELQCIRYRGTDPEVMRRIAEMGEPELCDVAPPALEPVRRNHVTFDTPDAWTTVDGLAAGFRRFLLETRGGRMRVQPAASSLGEAALAFAWFEDHFHTVLFLRNHTGDGAWLIRHPPNLGVADTVNDWLRDALHASNVRWYSEESFAGDRTWRSTPW